jgi:chaperonin cofactor prefoldin
LNICKSSANIVSKSAIIMAEPAQSFGKKILSFFIEEEQSATNPTVATPQPVLPQPTPATPIVRGTVDNKFVEHFANVLEKANLSGPDYFEFRQALRGMDNLGLTEEKQFQATWASFKAMSGTADTQVLNTSIAQYLNTLTADRTAFLKSADTAIQEKVGGLQNEQKQLQTENETLQKQIEALQKKMESNQERLSKIGGEIEEQSQKITQNRQNYEATYQQFTNQIQQDSEKIKVYLK